MPMMNAPMLPFHLLFSPTRAFGLKYQSIHLSLARSMICNLKDEKPEKIIAKFIKLASSSSHGRRRRQSFKIPITIARRETTAEAVNTDEPEISRVVVKIDCAIESQSQR
jgi:hypothetical protein